MIRKEEFGKIDNQVIHSYTLKNVNGMEIKCVEYGCIITDIIVQDKLRNKENVVLGFDTLEEYEKHSPYFGAVCGRVAGRITKGTFQLDRKTYNLAKNNGENHLHGGTQGFDKRVWDSTAKEKDDELSVEFSRVSEHGEEGYPGNVSIKVIYTLTNNNEFTITYEAMTDEDTLLNLTNHTYFNLSGNAKRDILDHRLQLNSFHFVELTEELVPSGDYLTVENTPFDFRKGKRLAEGVTSDHPQNILAGDGYDHPFLINKNHCGEIVLTDEESGRYLIIETDQPCVVVYNGTQLQDDYYIRGVQSKKYLGMCLETQGLPDAINHPHFPSVVLKKGEKYFSKTNYSFGLINE